MHLSGAHKIAARLLNVPVSKLKSYVSRQANRRNSPIPEHSQHDVDGVDWSQSSVCDDIKEDTFVIYASLSHACVLFVPIPSVLNSRS